MFILGDFRQISGEFRQFLDDFSFLLGDLTYFSRFLPIVLVIVQSSNTQRYIA
jgi:hypothetical protein